MDNSKDLLKRIVLVFTVIYLLTGSLVESGSGGGDSEHVHLKIHIPKMIKKHTHVQTILKHHFHKVPVVDADSDEDDGHKDGTEKYVKKLLASASGNELRSFGWSPRYNYQRGLAPQALKSVRRYPKHVKASHNYDDEQEYVAPVKGHRIVQHVVPAYEIQDEMEDGYDQPEEYTETVKPTKAYLRQSVRSVKSLPIQFIPASDLSQYIPTVPLSALTSSQSRFKPIWTPAEFMSRAAKSKEHHLRPSRGTVYEGKTMRVYSSGGSDGYTNPMQDFQRLRRDF